MALSPQDKAFYEQKLSMGSFGPVAGATIAVGAIVWPAMLFVMDWSNGHADKWTSSIAFSLCMMGLMLGSVVSVIMYLGFKFLLEMGWLPARR